MQTYQIVFKFQWQGNIPAQQIQLNITDQNSFTTDGQNTLQIQPYMAASAPLLSNFSMSSQRLFLNVGAASTQQGIQVTLPTAISGDSLQLNLSANTSEVSVSYAVMGLPVAGQLQAGNNTIPLQG
ncbi:hypothetical protein FNU76_17590 [Chitinimonas arctica]|uniref:Uncharacterized protein n=1 Tax=Chitinimonas arctica TaxID=2594795 RepID=A0A516SIP1_9NEIS|nr:hypothetical protein [Chitinimonas arctica]QDQ28011.1 hypothetical protein FNU76_17590 [Chitinimonas arctica]